MGKRLFSHRGTCSPWYCYKMSCSKLHTTGEEAPSYENSSSAGATSKTAYASWERKKPLLQNLNKLFLRVETNVTALPPWDINKWTQGDTHRYMSLEVSVSDFKGLFPIQSTFNLGGSTLCLESSEYVDATSYSWNTASQQVPIIVKLLNHHGFLKKLTKDIKLVPQNKSIF